MSDATDSRIETAVEAIFDVAATKLVEQVGFIPARFREPAKIAANVALNFVKVEILKLLASSGRVDIVGEEDVPVKITRKRRTEKS